MNEKSFVHMMLPVIVSCLLIVVAGGNAKSQVEESVSFNFAGGPDWRTVRLQIPIKVSESENFLAAPVKTLRALGIQVPQAAEAPWREFTQALRRMISAENAARSAGRRSTGSETITFKIVLTNSVRLLYVGTGETNETDSAYSRTAAKFLEDPVSTLRTKGAQVHTANERDWKQLADALKALKLAYNKPR